MGNIKLLKVGADPEFLYWNLASKTILPANLLCPTNGIHAWIGTDGASSTAELRPTPYSNVLMVVMDLAHAMREIETALRDLSESSGGAQNLVAVAQPHWGGANLGGHIHVSFRYSGQEVDAHRGLFASLDTLILPYYIETLQIPKWNAKGQRSLTSYTTRPQSVKHRPGVKASRLEYRRPGSWLAHPAIAYSYLGLAKLAVLNHPLTPLTVPFLDALDSIFQGEAKITKDLTDLPAACQATFEILAEKKPPLLVDFAAWRRLLE